MAVSTSYAPIEHVGDAAVVAIPITWQFFLSSHFRVVRVTDSTGAEADLALTTDYTVSGGMDVDGLPATGTLTMVAAAAVGETDRIERVTPKTQSSIWPKSNAFRAKTLEAALDWATLVDQELEYAAVLDIRGPWVTASVYKKNEQVTHGGATYYAKSAHTAGSSSEPGVGASWATYWGVSSAAGTDGIDGDDGATQDIFVQASEPADTGLSGSLWIDSDSTNYDLYQLGGGSWSDTGLNLKGIAGAGSGDMLNSENLSELASAPAARSNLGLGTAATSSSDDFAASSHSHTDTIAHERGGLEADVSAYSGLVRITGGTTSAVAAASQAEMQAGTETALRGMSPERVKQAIDALASGGLSEWARKTSAYTAVAGDRLLADTVATAAFTITLPASPSGGDEVTIAPSSAYETNNLTIGRNSQTIMGDAADLVVDSTVAVRLVYDGTDSDWRVF